MHNNYIALGLIIIAHGTAYTMERRIRPLQLNGTRYVVYTLFKAWSYRWPFGIQDGKDHIKTILNNIQQNTYECSWSQVEQEVTKIVEREKNFHVVPLNPYGSHQPSMPQYKQHGILSPIQQTNEFVYSYNVKNPYE